MLDNSTFVYLFKSIKNQIINIYFFSGNLNCLVKIQKKRARNLIVGQFLNMVIILSVKVQTPT
ncbi:hypothetical protein DKE48_002455 [Acinetobacter nosocomialis]|nr:hypothetical protein DKE48_002455 [Acinetobacter nosocomialis]